MSRAVDRANREGVYVTRGGLEYVSIAYAAQELNRHPQTIRDHIQSGNLKTMKESDMKKYGLSGHWILWSQCKEFYEKISKTRNADGSRKKRTDSEQSNDFTLSDLNSGKLAPVEKKEMPSLVDVDDPINSDCWKLNSANKPVIDKNGHHVILYDKFKQKYDALIRKQQYEREKGQLVAKDLVDTAFSKMLTPLVNTVNQIPDRYASRIIGLVESFTEQKLNNSQITSLRSMLDDEAKAIIETLNKNEEDALDGLLV